jgi:hypothetical protein
LNAARTVRDRVHQEDIAELVQGDETLRVLIRAVQQRQRRVPGLQDRRTKKPVERVAILDFPLLPCRLQAE